MLVQPFAEQGDERRVDERGQHRADADAVPPLENCDQHGGDGQQRIELTEEEFKAISAVLETIRKARGQDR